MNITTYFQSAKGTGVLATSDQAGSVDLALYTKPHVIDEKTIAFVMKARLSHKNLLSNLHAAYMFIEEGPGHKGCRLYLTMLREEINHSLVEALRQKQPEMFPRKDDSNKYIVLFSVDRVRPLVGDFEEA